MRELLKKLLYTIVADILAAELPKLLGKVQDATKESK